jgi:hypothetical protein
MTNRITPTGRIAFDNLSPVERGTVMHKHAEELIEQSIANPCNEIPMTARGIVSEEDIARLKAMISDERVVVVVKGYGAALAFSDPLHGGPSYHDMIHADYSALEARAMAHLLEDPMRDERRFRPLSMIAGAAVAAMALAGPGIEAERPMRDFRDVTPVQKPHHLQRARKKVSRNVRRGRGTYQLTKRQKKTYKGSTAAKRASARGGNHAAQNYRYV